MPNVTALLTLAGIGYEDFKSAGTKQVYLTSGNQLIGTYDDLCAFGRRNQPYNGWQAHHVVETHDLARLNIAASSPSRNEQLCVLLPERAHIGRVNSVLRRRAPIGCLVTPRDLLEAYSDAYQLIGDYCGGGERLLHAELFGLVRATFRAFKLV